MSFEYHDGERAVQRRAAGMAVADRGAEHGIHAELPPVAAAFLAEQVMIIVGHRDVDGAVWASALSGAAGFVTTTDERTVRVASRPVVGDALHGTLEAGPAAVGMLAIEPETRRRMRFNGQARLDGSDVVLRTEQVYANCPKYINTRHHEPLPGPIGEAQVERSTELTHEQQEHVLAADTFFVATSHATTGADASHRGGNPGFVRVAGPRRLTWPDYKGNSMFMTLGNLELDAHAGLLFLDWDSGDVLQLTGTATTDWTPERAAAFPGAERVVDFTVDGVVALLGALRWRWTFEKPSRFNPPAPASPPSERTRHR